jgi:glyoxylase-like metal-dependent hydrolase (beta-lactamase superfamily II)
VKTLERWAQIISRSLILPEVSGAMANLHRLNHNVYGVTGLFHPAGICVNAGFVITSDSIVHIDAGTTVSDGNYLISQSFKKAKGRKKLFLILTHHHSDHIFGMRVFKEEGARVIAHENVHKFLSHRTLPRFQRILDSYKSFIVKLMIKRFSYTKDEAERTLGDVKLFLPDEVFKGDKHLKMDEDELLLLYTPGHVPSEISIYHPKSKTLFAGDTIYEGMPLTTRFGGPKEWKLWIESLKKLNRLDIKKIVPGHGRICDKDEIQRNINYLQDLLDKRKT